MMTINPIVFQLYFPVQKTPVMPYWNCFESLMISAWAWRRSKVKLWYCWRNTRMKYVALCFVLTFMMAIHFSWTVGRKFRVFMAALQGHVLESKYIGSRWRKWHEEEVGIRIKRSRFTCCESKWKQCRSTQMVGTYMLRYMILCQNCCSYWIHLRYAIAVGSCGEFVGVKEKIIDGYEFKKHIEIASELAPQDHTIQHLLGRYVQEIASKLLDCCNAS